MEIVPGEPLSRGS